MANTYYQIYIHAVFAVKYKKAKINKEWKSEFQAVIGNLIKETGCFTIIVNGTEDHIHCLFNLKPSVSISNVMKIIKAKSSRWVNKKKLTTHKFAWQAGYGTFSYSHSQIKAVYEYIKNQEKHHQKRSFKDEYKDMLNKFNLNYEEAYIFKDLID